MFGNKSKALLLEKEEELMVVQTELFALKNKYQLTESEFQETRNAFLIAVADLKRSQEDYENLLSKYAPITDIEKTLLEKKLQIELCEQRISELDEKYRSALDLFKALEKQLNIHKDSLEISEYGLYQPQYSFDISEQYRIELENIYQQQKLLIGTNQAVKCNTEWEVGGSKAEGKKMTNRYSKLMLYAFNGECDAIISKVKWNNVARAELKIIQTFNNVNKLGTSHNISITDDFLQLKKKELALSYEYEQKKYEEKEEQRRIREQMREEEKAQKEYEKAQRDAEDEERRYQKALDKAKQELNTLSANPQELELLNERIKLLESNLAEAHASKERAISLAQQTKVGHIYVISNIGSFGEDVYKIGMTRRLDPQDRVKELGDASVPFHFDVHAIIYSDNAPQMEYDLHQKFKDRRLNRINQRKEFFRVTLDEIEEFVKIHGNAEIEFTKLAEAREFRETLTFLEQLNKLVETVQEEDRFPGSLM